MSPRTFTSLLVASLIVPVTAHALTTQSTAPVGFMRYSAEPGLQTVGFPLVNAHVYAGVVTSVGDASLAAVIGAGQPGLGARLDAGAAYYVEFTQGPEGDTSFVGDRIEVDVTRTRAANTPANRAYLALNNVRSTLPVVPEDLVGYHFVLRAHVTLAGAMGTGSTSVLQAGNSTTNGDQVFLLKDGAFSTYLFQREGTSSAGRWVKFPEGTPADQEPIAPGHGLFLRRVANSDATFEHLGSVRTNVFVQPLAAGYTLASEPFPVASDVASRGMNDDNGFVPGDTSTGADKIFLWTGSEYRSLFYARTAGAGANWRNADSVSQATTDTAMDFSPYQAMLIEKVAADPGYIVPSPF